MQEVVVGNQRSAVSELIGKGGEGEVYALKERTDLAVKIYNKGLREQREAKVRAMVGGGLATQTDLVAYPGEVVTDLHGRFVGFVMRLVSGYRPLHELYSPKSRQRHFPKADYRFIVHAALNVARAVGKVHQTGCVIGDLNHSGVLVAQDATVALIDADSFQFNLNGTTYPCVVGVPDFTPPELHGKNLASLNRTVEHDNFGLAVAIFHLLFMGRHPYAGRYQGPDISMGEAIAQNRFAFSLTRQNSTKTTPPPGTLTLDQFPDSVGVAFEAAFGLSPSARPGASDWIQALSKLEGGLNRCSRVRSHYFPNAAKSCVWCNLSGKSGFDMFPDLTSVAPNVPTDAKGTEQAIREIAAFRFPTLTDLLPQLSKPRGASSSLRQARRSKRGSALLGLIMIGGAIAGGAFAISVWFIWVGLAIWGWFTFSNREVEIGPFKRSFDDAEDQLQRELDSFVRRNGLAEVVQVRSDLDAFIAEYKEHDNRLSHAIMVLKSNREARQRQAFLDRFSIRRAHISGIGPAKTATLISFGIETAADVNKAAVLQVPGFGDVTTGKLMDWRRGHEARFRYQRTPTPQDTADERALRAKFAIQKSKLESSIRNGLGTLRNARARLDALPNRAQADSSLRLALETRNQAARDLELLGVSVPQSTVELRLRAFPKASPPPPRPAYKFISPNTGKGASSNRSATSASSTPSCPLCGSSMKRRLARRGRNAGNYFWGCSRYPNCKGTRSI